jgi:hypothetical protein
VDKTEKSPKAGKATRVFLSHQEDYDLAAWLHARTPVWGEKPQDVYNAARAALNIPHLNCAHVRTRLSAYTTIPKAQPPEVTTLEDRLVRVEIALAILGRFHVGKTTLSAGQLDWMEKFANQKLAG